jgi:hypothetical protein
MADSCRHLNGPNGLGSPPLRSTRQKEMNALIALGGVVVGGAVGYVAGAFVGDDGGDFPMGMALGALVGAGVGAAGGAVVAVAVFGS